jgi:hypothetical protein
METLPKHAPHAFAHARPWDKFKGKSVGRKQCSRAEVFVPGHKKNPLLEEGPTSSGAYGAFAGGPPRASAVEISRRQFGAHSVVDDAPKRGVADVLGPVDLSRERTVASHRPTKKLEEPPPDTLRWNPEAAGGGAAGARRREVSRRLEEAEHPLQPSVPREPEAAAKAAAAAKRKNDVPLVDPLRDHSCRAPRAVLHEEKQRVRAMLEEEAKAQRALPPSNAAASGVLANAGVAASGMTAAERRAALSDPRVQAALDKALNGPNNIAAEANRARNTQRVSAERRW